MNADSDPSATNVTHPSGGADLNARRDINVGGDVAGHDIVGDESIRMPSQGYLAIVLGFVPSTFCLM